MAAAGWVGAISLAILSSSGPELRPIPARFEFRQTHMGSEFKIVLYTTGEAQARLASDAGFARIAALDKALSDYDPESELMRLCDKAGGPPVKASDDLFRCLDQAQAMSVRSDGAFDATIAPVVRLWRRARRTRVLPEAETLAKARALVGYRAMDLDPKARTVRLRKPGMKLDLGGIAKGFACDEAMAALKKAGITCALVAGAGDIVVSDPPPDERGWRIGVADPEGDPDRPTRFLVLKNKAISTSGDAERFVEIGGTRYSHIVDPRTGLGVVARASVTIVASDGTTADALATAAYVLGHERGIALIEKIGASGLYVQAGPKPKTYATRHWADLPGEIPARK
ncbi:MAG: rane-associated lipoprotein involved in thiamine biosynthesis [Planctomycetota bacterium]|nr:rane-associated lipoprotein involved in thiamine biosynthesis [Planctomycetota bacterium]